MAGFEVEVAVSCVLVRCGLGILVVEGLAVLLVVLELGFEARIRIGYGVNYQLIKGDARQDNIV